MPSIIKIERGITMELEAGLLEAPQWYMENFIVTEEAVAAIQTIPMQPLITTMGSLENARSSRNFEFVSFFSFILTVTVDIL